MILAVVEDLIFLSKIQQSAKLAGVLVEPVDPGKVEERAMQVPVRAVILDLNHRSGSSVEVLRAIKANHATNHLPVLGFLSHVHTELAAAAHAAGCDLVLARSAFSQQLPKLLEKLSAIETAASPGP